MDLVVNADVFVRTIDCLDVTLFKLPNGFVCIGALEIRECHMTLALQIERSLQITHTKL